MTKWSVTQHHRIRPDDLRDDGRVSDAAVQRWIAIARSAYLAQCKVLETMRVRHGLKLRDRSTVQPGGAALAPASGVVVTASATEVLPSSFVISVRLRPVGGESDDPVNATCVIRLEDPTTGEAHEIGNDVRDELIALEHAARHFN